MIDPNFWNDPSSSAGIQREHKNIMRRLEEISQMDSLLDDCEVSCELIEMGGDIEEEGLELFSQMEELLDELEVDTLLSGEYDEFNCILSIQAGTGGLDAQDWSMMLMRMYMRYADKKEFKTKVLDILEDEEAGIKHVSILVEGDYAYGLLKAEAGVHRLVRISPFNSSGKRQTSFAAVEVVPEIEEDDSLEINQEDLRIDTYRSGGAGGQHVNVTDSAVRITHLPTGIVVSVQNERSQMMNRETAMKILRGRLLEKKMEEEQAKIDELKGDFKEIAWGSQIRSYVLNPYNLVKDHRTGEETGNVSAVLDGAVEPFIQRYLKETRKHGHTD
jgi:peptide chain release factor 2